MRCSQCGFEAAQGAMFCSRCGTRLFAPKPAAIREYVLLKVRPSLWYCANFFIVGLLVTAFGGRTLYAQHNLWRTAFALMALGAVIIVRGLVANRSVDWNVTSERTIDHRA